MDLTFFVILSSVVWFCNRVTGSIKIYGAINFGAINLLLQKWKNGTILWRHNMVPFNGAILWHVCTGLKAHVNKKSLSAGYVVVLVLSLSFFWCMHSAVGALVYRQIYTLNELPTSPRFLAVCCMYVIEPISRQSICQSQYDVIMSTKVIKHYILS